MESVLKAALAIPAKNLSLLECLVPVNIITYCGSSNLNLVKISLIFIFYMLDVLNLHNIEGSF